MPIAKCSEEEFIRLFEELGAMKLASHLNIDIRKIYERRASLQVRIGRAIVNPTSRKNANKFSSYYEARIPLELMDGTIMVGSDAHFWPEEITTAFRGFIYMLKEIKPEISLLNGDVFDGARISRHPPSGWNHVPTVKQELEAVTDRLHEIEQASPQSKKLWTIGNHDLRYENRLAQQTPEYEGVQGFSFKDKFPTWELGMSFWVNDQVVIKHRWKGGIHATHNNTVNSGKSIVTGHLHSLKVTPFDDYNGTRFGVDTGTLAHPTGPQFAYIEDNPTNWRSGFIVLTFKNGRLLWPEICHVLEEGVIQFRGKTYEV